MTDPAKPTDAKNLPAEIIKDAEVIKPDAPLAGKQLTFGQHVFIWTMILFVGVLFGMGSSVSLLQHGPRTIAGVSENDILVRQDTARRLQDILNPQHRRIPGFQFDYGSQPAYATDILRSRYAASLGLRPDGAELDAVVERFLAKSLPGETTRTIREALIEHQGGPTEVTMVALRRHLSERTAVEALEARYVYAPAISSANAEDLAALGEQLVTDEVVLSANHLVVPIEDTDAELQVTYEKMRSSRFAAPATVQVQAAWPDLAALSTAVVVDPAAIQAWYDAHQDRFRTPAADGKPAGVKPLTEVTDEVATAIRREQAEAESTTRSQRFAEAIDSHPDANPAKFSELATQAGLTVTDLVIPEPKDGQLDLSAFGKVRDQIGLFTSTVENGFISSPLQLPAGAAATWITLRVVGRTPAGFKELNTVKPEVMAQLAGQRVRAKLLEAAEAARAAAQAGGQGGLAAWVTSDAAKAWNATVVQKTIGALQELRAPAKEAGGLSGDPIVLASLALPDRPVFLAEQEGNEGDLPTVRLIQVRAVEPAKPIEAARKAQFADGYRYALLSFSAKLFDDEIRTKVSK